MSLWAGWGLGQGSAASRREGGADVRWAEALLATGLGRLAIEAGVEVDAEASRALAWAPGAGCREVGLGEGRAARPCSWAV